MYGMSNVSCIIHAVSRIMYGKSPVSHIIYGKSPVSRIIYGKSPLSHIIHAKSPVSHIYDLLYHISYFGLLDLQECQHSLLVALECGVVLSLVMEVCHCMHVALHWLLLQQRFIATRGRCSLTKGYCIFLNTKQIVIKLLKELKQCL